MTPLEIKQESGLSFSESCCIEPDVTYDPSAINVRTSTNAEPKVKQERDSYIGSGIDTHNITFRRNYDSPLTYPRRSKRIMLSLMNLQQEEDQLYYFK